MGAFYYVSFSDKEAGVGGCIGRLLAGASIARSWGRCEVRDLSGLRSVRGYKAGTRGLRARHGGCRPLAWQRLVWAGSGSAQGALLRGWEKSRGQASRRANLTQYGIPTPGECPLVSSGSPRRGASLKGCSGPLRWRAGVGASCGSPAPGTFHSSRVPRIRSRREQRPRAPRTRRNGAALPQRSTEGSPARSRGARRSPGWE